MNVKYFVNDGERVSGIEGQWEWRLMKEK